jgi:ammonia channel protein AmtB
MNPNFKLDTGATAWVLASTALVLLMTPGLAFFYGGMVRQKNVLGMLMQNFTTMAVVSVLWVLLGFSLAFGSGNGFIGDLHFAGLQSLAERARPLRRGQAGTAPWAVGAPRPDPRPGRHSTGRRSGLVSQRRRGRR